MPAKTKLITAAITAATAFLVLAPFAGAIAQAPSTQPAAGFCTRLNTIDSAVSQRLNDLETKRTAQRDAIIAQLKQRRDERQAKIQQDRTEAQTELDDHLTALEAEATTDAQKQALADFKTAVQSAQATRKAAVDAAQSTFRTGVDAAVTTRQASLKTAVAAFKASILAALQKAKNDCAAGVNVQTVRQDLIAAIQAAKTKLRSDVQGLDKVGPQVEALAKTRNDAVKQANQAFRTAVEQAKEKLKAAFPNS